MLAGDARDDIGLATVFMTVPPVRAAHVCARHPNGTPTERRRFAPRGGKESLPPRYWRRRPARQPGPSSGNRLYERSRYSSPSSRPESSAAPARHVAGTQCPARPTADRVRARAIPRSRPLSRRVLEPGVPADQIRARKLVLHLARQRVRIVAQENGANPALALWRRGSTRANTRPRRTGCLSVRRRPGRFDRCHAQDGM